MNRLKELREARGLTLEQLADRVGTDKSMIQKLEKGRRRLTEQWLDRLAKGLNVHFAEILESQNGNELSPLSTPPVNARGSKKTDNEAVIGEGAMQSKLLNAFNVLPPDRQAKYLSDMQAEAIEILQKGFEERSA